MTSRAKGWILALLFSLGCWGLLLALLVGVLR